MRWEKGSGVESTDRPPHLLPPTDALAKLLEAMEDVKAVLRLLENGKKG